jgi:UDP-glucose 4-epimerase
MTRGRIWVVGRGGLLGSALARTLGSSEFHLSQPLDWHARDVTTQLRSATRELAAAVQGSPEPWQVCWCAGAGVVGTSAEALAKEGETLRALLLALAAEPGLSRTRGNFVLSSSAGGVHGGTATSRVTEANAPQPISAYGRAKLEQERTMAELAPRFGQLSTLVARLSNLYGPAQRLEKPQGLISQLSRSMILGVPAQIYVPLDTMRDYLFADDAARLLAAGLARLTSAPAPSHELKLYASERDTSIASLLDIFGSIAKRRLRVVAGLHAVSTQQPRHLSFRSTRWPEDRQLIRTPLVEGVGAVYRHQLRLFQMGRLASPRSLA